MTSQYRFSCNIIQIYKDLHLHNSCILATVAHQSLFHLYFIVILSLFHRCFIVIDVTYHNNAHYAYRNIIVIYDECEPSLTLLTMGFSGCCSHGGGHIVPPLYNSKTTEATLMKLSSKNIQTFINISA